MKLIKSIMIILISLLLNCSDGLNKFYKKDTIPGNLVASITANKTTGVAPLAVFFEANVQVKSGDVFNAFHYYGYEWTFGDSGSGNWTQTGRTRNKVYGPLAGHVFETPGTYTVNLTIKSELGTTNVTPITITVTDPDDIFGETNTYCFSTNGDFTSCPTTIPTNRITTSSFDTAIRSYVHTGRRLLFHRGQTWNATDTQTINLSGPIIIGAFGTGNKPVIDVSGVAQADEALVISGQTPNIDNLIIMDLDFIGANNQKYAIHAENTIKNVLFSRLEFSSLDRCISASLSKPEWYEKPIHSDITIFECEFTNTNEGIIFPAERLLILGNKTINNINTSNIQCAFIYKGVISENYLQDPENIRYSISINSIITNPIVTTNHTSHFIISGNIIRIGNNNWNVAIMPSHPRQNELIEMGIIERNYFETAANTHQIYLAASNMTIRNNIFNITNINNPAAIYIDQRGEEEQLPTNNHVFNNSCFKNDTIDSATFLQIDETAINTIAKNNLFYAPNVTTINVVDDSGTNTDESNNLGIPNPVFDNNPPSSPNHYNLFNGSIAIDAGNSIGQYIYDYNGSSRNKNGDSNSIFANDLGAFEY